MKAFMTFGSLLILPSCIIVGDFPKGTGWDTASVGHATEEAVVFVATPERIEGPGKAEISIVAEPSLSFADLVDVYSMGQAEVLAFEAFDHHLELLVAPKPTAQEGTLSLIFDFGNEEVHFAQDVVQIDLLPDDLEGERGDDGQEQTQNENEQNTGEQDPTD